MNGFLEAELPKTLQNTFNIFVYVFISFSEVAPLGIHSCFISSVLSLILKDGFFFKKMVCDCLFWNKPLSKGHPNFWGKTKYIKG